VVAVSLKKKQQKKTKKHKKKKQKKETKNRLKLRLDAGLKNLEIVAVMLTPRLIFAVVQRFLSTF